MSTAGKVLCVLIMLASLAWLVLMSGVDQLNRNANQALNALTEKVAKLEEDVKNSQDEIGQVKNQTSLIQEQVDRELTVIGARQNDVQRLASNVAEILSRVRYELTTVQQTVQEAEQDKKQRTDELAAERLALEAARNEVKALQAVDAQYRERLQQLRTEFKNVFNSSLGILQQTAK
jgi:chromosome segregation ATPase